MEAARGEVLDQATAARTIAELKAEIETLKRLEDLAHSVRRSGRTRSGASWQGYSARFSPTDSKKRRLASVPNRFHPKIKNWSFSPSTGTLSITLKPNSGPCWGGKEAVVFIHGGMGREERLKAQEVFRHDPEVQVLIATDAAGEGINLQRAHLMVNYDLLGIPIAWSNASDASTGSAKPKSATSGTSSPKRPAKAMFTEPCSKSWRKRGSALGGQVFDVLGQFSSRDAHFGSLLIEAIRYGEQPEIRASSTQMVENAFDREQLQELDRRARLGARRDGRKPRP